MSNLKRVETPKRNSAFAKQKSVHYKEEHETNITKASGEKAEAKKALEAQGFEADHLSLLYMNIAMTLANYKFNVLIANGVAPATAKVDTLEKVIVWKKKLEKADVAIGEIALASEEAMNKLAVIVGAV